MHIHTYNIFRSLVDGTELTWNASSEIDSILFPRNVKYFNRSKFMKARRSMAVIRLSSSWSLSSACKLEHRIWIQSIFASNTCTLLLCIYFQFDECVLLDLLDVVEAQRYRLQAGVVVSLECPLRELLDRVVIQFKRLQATEKMETCVAERVQVIVAQVEMTQRGQWAKCLNGEYAHRRSKAMSDFQWPERVSNLDRNWMTEMLSNPNLLGWVFILDILLWMLRDRCYWFCSRSNPDDEGFGYFWKHVRQLFPKSYALSSNLPVRGRTQRTNRTSIETSWCGREPTIEYSAF